MNKRITALTSTALMGAAALAIAACSTPADTTGTEEPANIQDASGADMTANGDQASDQDIMLASEDNITGEVEYIEDPDEFETPDGEGVGVNAPGADGTAPPAGSGTEPQVIETPNGAFSVGSEGDPGSDVELGEPEEDIPPSE